MLIDLSQKLPPLTADETYAAFLNSLRFREGFGIIFLDCSPGEANRLIPRVKQDLPKRNIEVLNLVEPINNLYKLVEGMDDRTSLNILFIRGLEKSLEADVKPGYKGLGDYYNLNTVPPILSHLNQQRENFRDHFSNICFVFVLPKFAIRYFVRRAPDFYDWSSGLFEMADQKGLRQSYSIQGEFGISDDSPLSDIDSVRLCRIEKKCQTWGQKFFATVSKLWSKNSEVAQGSVTKKEVIGSYEWASSFKRDDHKAWFNRGIALSNLSRHEEAIISYDQAIKYKLDDHQAWNNRGIALSNLGRHEEAIISYDRAIEYKPDDYQAWNNRGGSLNKLGRYEEEITSYDRAVEIKPDFHETWYNRGNSLYNLGRYEEAIESYERAISLKHYNYKTCFNGGITMDSVGRYNDLKHDLHEAWFNRGISLYNLGRYEEAIKSYDRALEIKPDKYKAWFNRGICLDNLGRYEESIESYDRATEINPNLAIHPPGTTKISQK
jgi:tetratricopeptide (TPR) repeat protein